MSNNERITVAEMQAMLSSFAPHEYVAVIVETTTSYGSCSDEEFYLRTVCGNAYGPRVQIRVQRPR